MKTGRFESAEGGLGRHSPGGPDAGGKFLCMSSICASWSDPSGLGNKHSAALATANLVGLLHLICLWRIRKDQEVLPTVDFGVVEELVVEPLPQDPQPGCRHLLMGLGALRVFFAGLPSTGGAATAWFTTSPLWPH